MFPYMEKRHETLDRTLFYYWLSYKMREAITGKTD